MDYNLELSCLEVVKSPYEIDASLPCGAHTKVNYTLSTLCLRVGAWSTWVLVTVNKHKYVQLVVKPVKKTYYGELAGARQQKDSTVYSDSTLSSIRLTRSQFTLLYTQFSAKPDFTHFYTD